MKTIFTALKSWFRQLKTPPFNLQEETNERDEKIKELLNKPDTWSKERYLLEEKKSADFLFFVERLGEAEKESSEFRNLILDDLIKKHLPE